MFVQILDHVIYLERSYHKIYFAKLKCHTATYIHMHNHIIFVRLLICSLPPVFLKYYNYFVCQTDESALEGKLDVYKEWTSRRPWKERKRASKAKVNGTSQLISQIQDPELIFYGPHSGVVGLSKSELYQNVHDNEVLNCGYDKVICI